MTDERPLHVRVAEALGWKIVYPSPFAPQEWVGASPDATEPWVGTVVPRYDTDWSATGPIIYRLKISIDHDEDDAHPGQPWEAISRRGFVGARSALGQTPLIATCRLLLYLHEAETLADLLAMLKAAP